MTKKRIAIVGAGQLGSRHLQGMALSQFSSEIWVVDPNEDNLKQCSLLYGMTTAPHQVHYISNIQLLPQEVDFVVVSTTANVRLQVIQQIVNQSSIGGLLLEKVLFQSLEDFQSAAKIINDKKIKTWVNCANREFEVMHRVKSIFMTDTIIHLDVSGGNWGLGCNSIHFVDLLKFLSNETSALTVDSTSLDSGWIPAKRNGFIEFTGALRGSIGRAKFILNSFADIEMPSIISIRGIRKTCILDNAAGILLHQKDAGEKWHSEEYKIPYQSSLTGMIVDKFHREETIFLPSFDESIELHVPILDAFLAHMRRCGNPSKACPIT